MEKLVCIGKIIEINDIPKADFIKSFTVDCAEMGTWIGTARNDIFSIGQFCEVYLHDSIVPKTERFEFMKKYKHIVRMKRFKKVPSEVLIMPIDFGASISPLTFKIGMDITHLKDVKKYIKPLPLCLYSDVKRYRPEFFPKTNEENFQSVPNLVKHMKGVRFYSTLKADGTSGSYYRCDNDFGVCGRTLEFKENYKNNFWKIAEELNLKKCLPNNLVLQGEVVGPGIQKNPMGLTKIEFQLFNIYNINTKKYLNVSNVLEITKKLGIKTVTFVDYNKIFDFKNDEELRLYAEQLYPNGKRAEGVVIRPMEEDRINGYRLSFKVLNLKYKG